MIARHFTAQLKPNVAKEFTNTFEKEILPIMRRQKGFLDELMLFTPMKNEVIFVSFWDAQESIDTYHRQAYPEVVKINAKFLEGTPVIKNLDVEYTTFRKAATVGV